MANKLYEETNIQAIANAIRAKGQSGTMTVAQMPSKIASIPSGGITPSGTKDITANGNGIDVTNYAAVNVNVPILSKSWEVTFTSNQTNVVTLLTDSWLADNYDNDTLAISVVPTFAIPQANACIIGGYRCNFSIAQVSGQTAKTGYRCYHTANNANPSAVYITKNVSGGGASEAGMIGLESNGTLKISAPSTYPLLAGSYKITASVQQRGD